MGTWDRHLRWDPADRLMAAWSSATPTDAYAFAYDAGGERVPKYRVDVGAVAEATFFIRDEGGNVLSEFVWVPLAGTPDTGSWSRTADHVYLGRNEIVRLDHVPLGGNQFEERLTTLVLDHLGSTRREIGSGGTTASLEFRPFGEMVVSQGGSLKNNARLFTAHEREFVGDEQVGDPLLGLDYMHARYYSSGLGRFLSVDPVGGKVGSSQGWNRYAYVMNSPLLLVDPSGADEEDRIEVSPIRKVMSVRVTPIVASDEWTETEVQDQLIQARDTFWDQASVMLEFNPVATSDESLETITWGESTQLLSGAARTYNYGDGSVPVIFVGVLSDTPTNAGGVSIGPSRFSNLRSSIVAAFYSHTGSPTELLAAGHEMAHSIFGLADNNQPSWGATTNPNSRNLMSYGRFLAPLLTNTQVEFGRRNARGIGD